MVSANVEIFSVSSVVGFLSGDQVCRVLNMAIDWRTPKYFSRASSLQRLLLWPFINWRIRRYVTDSSFAGFVFQGAEWTARLDRFFHGYEINEIIVKIVAEPKVRGAIRRPNWSSWNVHVFEIQIRVALVFLFLCFWFLYFSFFSFFFQIEPSTRFPV